MYINQRSLRRQPAISVHCEDSQIDWIPRPIKWPQPLHLHQISSIYNVITTPIHPRIQSFKKRTRTQITHQLAEKSMTTSLVLEVSKTALYSSMVVMCLTGMMLFLVYVSVMGL
jgi:hypothetical protein